MKKDINYDLIKELITNSAKILDNPNSGMENESILSLFRKDYEKKSKKRKMLLLIRIYVINNSYSTQLEKNPYSVEDIIEKLTNYTDEELRKYCEDFLEDVDNEDNQINKLLTKKDFGTRKSKKKGSGTSVKSFLSKYMFFLMEEKFPIYDRHSKETLSKFYTNNLNYLKKDLNFFKEVIKFKEKLGKRFNYKKIDNFLWLYGKVSEKSFTVFLVKKQFKNLPKKMEVPLIKKERKNYKKNYSIGDFKHDLERIGKLQKKFK